MNKFKNIEKFCKNKKYLKHSMNYLIIIHSLPIMIYSSISL